MTRFLLLWRDAQRADPEAVSKVLDKAWSGMRDLVAKGVVKELGIFIDGISGYAIVEEESANVSGYLAQFMPYWKFTVQEILPVDVSKVPKPE